MSEIYKKNPLAKQAYLRYHNDGVWDLFLGIWLTASAVSFFLDLAFFMGIWAAVLVPAAAGAKKSFTQRRLGFVRFVPEQRARENLFRMMVKFLVAGTIVLALVMFALLGSEGSFIERMRGFGIVPVGVLIAIPLAGLGLALGVTRFVLHAMLILLAFVAVHAAGVHAGWAFLGPGILILVFGLVLMIGFMRRYPRETRGGDGDVS